MLVSLVCGVHAPQGHFRHLTIVSISSSGCGAICCLARAAARGLARSISMP